MSSLKPYLVRAIYEWIIDNDLTPYLLVDATRPHCVLPTDFVDNGRIVLNIRPAAVQNLNLGNDEVSFNARFAGVGMTVTAPLPAVLAIYAKETGKGMFFEPEEDETPPQPQPEADDKKAGKPFLRVVK